MLSVALLELTLRGILNDIPRDAGSIVAYILLLFIVAVIAYGSRGGTRPAEQAREADAGGKSPPSRMPGGR